MVATSTSRMFGYCVTVTFMAVEFPRKPGRNALRTKHRYLGVEREWPTRRARQRCQMGLGYFDATGIRCDGKTT
jgi:hypothetical protein